MALTLVILIFSVILHISFQINEKPENLNEILDKLIQETENGNFSDIDPNILNDLKSDLNKSSNSNNDSRIVRVKTIAKPDIYFSDDYDTKTNESIELKPNSVSSDDDNFPRKSTSILREGDDIILEKEVIIEVEDPIPKSSTVEQGLSKLINSIARSGRPDDYPKDSVEDAIINTLSPVGLQNNPDFLANNFHDKIKSSYLTNKNIVPEIQKTFDLVFRPKENDKDTELLNSRLRVFQYPVHALTGNVLKNHAIDLSLPPIISPNFLFEPNLNPNIINPYLHRFQPRQCCGNVILNSVMGVQDIKRDMIHNLLHKLLARIAYRPLYNGFIF